jgi:hypothetical protein
VIYLTLPELLHVAGASSGRRDPLGYRHGALTGLGLRRAEREPAAATTSIGNPRRRPGARQDHPRRPAPRDPRGNRTRRRARRSPASTRTRPRHHRPRPPLQDHPYGGRCALHWHIPSGRTSDGCGAAAWVLTRRTKTNHSQAPRRRVRPHPDRDQLTRSLAVELAGTGIGSRSTRSPGPVPDPAERGQLDRPLNPPPSPLPSATAVHMRRVSKFGWAGRRLFCWSCRSVAGRAMPCRECQGTRGA